MTALVLPGSGVYGRRALAAYCDALHSSGLSTFRDDQTIRGAVSSAGQAGCVAKI